MEDNLLGNILRSNAAAIALGVLALGSVSASPALAQTPAPAAPAAAPLATETFGSWGMTCAQPNACQIQTLLGDKDKKFIGALVYGKTGGVQKLVAIVPLGFRLQNNPTFAIDGGAAVTGTYVQCMSTGCRVEFPVNDATVRSLQSGKQATATMISPRNEPKSLNFDLKGFGDARAALDKKMP